MSEAPFVSLSARLVDVVFFLCISRGFRNFNNDLLSTLFFCAIFCLIVIASDEHNEKSQSDWGYCEGARGSLRSAATFSVVFAREKFLITSHCYENAVADDTQ